jgi:hypothetical protein
VIRIVGLEISGFAAHNNLTTRIEDKKGLENHNGKDYIKLTITTKIVSKK